MRTIDEIKANIEIVNSANAILGYPTDGTLITELRNELRLALTADIPLDRLEQICKAEKDGRCLVLPCNVDDTAYIICNDGCLHYGLCENACHGFNDSCISYKKSDDYIAETKFSFGDLDRIGKAIFLTREEAEAALEGQK